MCSVFTTKNIFKIFTMANFFRLVYIEIVGTVNSCDHNPCFLSTMLEYDLYYFMGVYTHAYVRRRVFAYYHMACAMT